jgi:hypothetical protein
LLLWHNSPVERNALALPLTTITTMKNLIYSSNKVDFAAVKAIETPAPMGPRHFPIPHDRLIDEARQSLNDNGFTIDQEEHGLSEGGMNCFSGFALRKAGFDNEERQLVMGLRNSHNQKFAGSLAIGNSMLVCENLCFSSDITLARKHTQNIFNDLPFLFNKAIGQVQQTWDNQGKRIEAYKNTEANEVSVLNKLVKAGLIKPTKIEAIFDNIENGGVDKDGNEGAFSEYKGTLWNVYNAVTESFKNLTANNVMHLPRMTMQAQQIFDRVVNPPEVVISQDDRESALVLPA